MSTVSKIAEDLWKEFDRRLIKEGFIAEDAEIVLCHIPRHLKRITEGVLGFWNSMAAGGWATIGPRMLGPTFEQGTLQKAGKRTYLTVCPVASKLEIVVKKRDGKAGATVVVSVHRRDGSHVTVDTLRFPDDKTTPTKRATIEGRVGIVSVKLEAEMGAIKVDKFAYSIKAEEIVDKSFTKRASGFADLHVHQMAEYAYLGKWLHGSHRGREEKALVPCTGLDHAVPSVIWNLFNAGATASKVYHGKGHPSFEDWPHHLDMGHQQVHGSWLKQAHEGGLNLMVSCAVNNEPWTLLMGSTKPTDILTHPFRDMPVLERQIEAVHAFAAEHPWYEIALHPWHARKIIAEGKLAVVISVEASNILPRDEGDFIDQLDKLYAKGVRCIQIAHEVDSRFAGAAAQEKVLQVLQTAKNLTKLDFHLGMHLDDKNRNRLGLTEDGAKLVKAIMDRHMILDTAHLSARALDDVFKIARARGKYPLVSTHTKFEEVLKNEEKKVQREFLTTRRQLAYYKETGGIVGLRTAPWVNKHAVFQVKERDGGTRPETCPVAADNGEVGTARSFAQMVFYAERHGLKIALGSDINGFTNQVGPRSATDSNKPPSVSKDYWKHGFRHIGLLPDLVADLKALGVPGAPALADSAEAFLQTWERTWERD